MTEAAEVESTDRPYRIQPSVGVAVAMVIAYTVVVNGLQIALRDGIGYDDFFDTTEGTYRGAVIPLYGGWALLIAFMLIARWDFLWKDAGRLRMSPLLWAPLVVMVLGTAARFADIDYGELPSGLFFAVLLAGIGVGFAEEMLFRGIVLRGLRTNQRSEGHAVFWTSVGFGAFHVGNMLLGAPVVATLGQMVLAAIAGVVLYLARRAWGLIIVGMVLHGVYDMSSFLDGAYPAKTAFEGVAFAAVPLTAILAVVALVVIMRKDKDITMTTSGPQPIART